MIRNKYKIIATRSALIFGIISLALFLIPSLTGMDGMDGGFAMMVFAFLMLLTGIIIFYYYIRTARVFESILQPENVVAQWHIGQVEYAQLQKLDVKEVSGNFLLMRWVVIFITFIVCVFLAIIGLDFSFLIVFFIGLSAFIWLVSAIAMHSQKRRLRPAEAHVILTREGGIINETLHVWAKLNNRLEDASIQKIKSGIHYLEVTYSVPSRGARVETTARFPVPEGMLTEAQFVLNEIFNQQ
ncbi:MAG: hypothetical protein A2W93_02410 [Bacteroidetes bacterium GWF2_43_63]|nr:MAG: hypothetical protein A2W94_08415 [Bacteroidetes bacterium GWE2_42_42]OFY53526.1 MAG: hypothetical protein A2W93_02410 [Bacteroidetes bacterium GWF2_43_63]HBG71148.1 hypothetical protein [Bacteroidales bacterium]HCB63726.1 hypothetical protein [Bacteroidales bacterium]HCY24475.1 hypothetical protein [Bacteroidales bacterium]